LVQDWDYSVVYDEEEDENAWGQDQVLK